jgi:hypothetical protein
MKNEPEIEIPSAAEILERSKFKQKFLKAKDVATSLIAYGITIALAIPVLVGVCRYTKFIWNLMF